MIELKDVSARKERCNAALERRSELFHDGVLRLFDRDLGELIIDVLLGFCPVSEGYVCFDGMPLDARSAPFIRKMIAYIPSPEGFQNVKDKGRKQLEMIAEAIQSDAAVVLAVDPFSHLNAAQAAEAADAFREKARQGAAVIIATERRDLFES